MLVLLSRTFKTGWTGWLRHGWLSVVASFIMAQALVIISIFIVLNIVIGGTIEGINKKLDLAVYFKDQASEEQITAMKDWLSSDTRVTAISYVSKAEAKKRYAEQNKNNAQLVQLINEDDNFLPASLEVRVTDPYDIEGVVSSLNSGAFSQLVSKTSFSDNQQLVQRLRGISSFIQRITIVLGLLFVIIALMIIFNTIRITIFTRHKEIEIMKLVGATDWYVRWPFIFEGILYAIGATLLSVGFLSALYYFFVMPMVSGFLGGAGGTGAYIFSWGFAAQLIGLQIIVALIVGVSSSYVATWKYLKT